MTPLSSTLSDAFLQQCPLESGFIIRGENMTRIETFVDAAFAFAITMLVISLDTIPRSPHELFEASKGIPAFLASAAQIGFIWHRHSQWSRRFGLEDGRTVLLSMLMVALVLIFVYPLKLVFVGLFAWISGGYLTTHPVQMSLNELANLFLFFATGFFALAMIFYWLNKNALRLADRLRLTAFEQWQTQTDALGWLATALVAIIAAIMSQTLPGMWVTLSGFVFGLLGIVIPLLHRYRRKNSPVS